MNDQQNLPGIDVAGLRNWFVAGKSLVVLDVREDFEREIAKIRLPESAADVHVPLGQIPQRLEELRHVSGSSPLIVYCHHGIRSLAAAEWLQRQGFQEVINLEGGIDCWSEQVDSTVPRY